MKCGVLVATMALVLLSGGPHRALGQEPPATEPVIDPLIELAGKIEAVVAKRDHKGYAQFFDFETLFRTATANVEVTPDMLLIVRRGFDDAAGGFTQTVVKSLDTWGSYKFIRKVDSPTGPRLIFRISGPNGLNYHQLLIAPSPLGDLKIADIDIMVTNELLSRTLQRILEQALVQAGKGSSIKESRAQITQFIGQMQKLLIDGKPSEAYSFYDMLPESVRAERAAQVIRIQAAVPLGEQQLNKAIDDYRTTFKDDPNVDLFLIRIFTMQNQFDEADASIARLDRWAGGDPVLNLPRSNVALKRGDLAGARSLAEQAARREPTLCAAHQQLLVVALQANDHAETLRLLRLLRDQFKMSFPDLSKSPEFAEFIKTDEYRQWRGAAPKSQPAVGSTTRPGFKF